eukprot:TRINITY_DN27321_c0_g1_i1.p1 TRINITY_DN27321_c0_g1~~TRINITY_DN27321_c0_g1_i1.p1  ORF type:complete len:137 (+),score=17.21 TRINITY_DN27321_c0_g1_i1:25-411(+)
MGVGPPRKTFVQMRADIDSILEVYSKTTGDWIKRRKIKEEKHSAVQEGIRGIKRRQEGAANWFADHGLPVGQNPNGVASSYNSSTIFPTVHSTTTMAVPPNQTPDGYTPTPPPSVRVADPAYPPPHAP